MLQVLGLLGPNLLIPEQLDHTIINKKSLEVFIMFISISLAVIATSVNESLYMLSLCFEFEIMIYIFVYFGLPNG